MAYFGIGLIALAILMVLLTFWLIYKTRFGLKVRAVRRNRAMAGALGIDTARIDMLIFMFGSGLAGIAGAVLAPIKSVSTTMGFSYAVGSYMVIVLGGVGNLLGVPTGSFLIGQGETLLAYKYNTVIGQLLVSVVGFGHLFEIYSSNLLMEHMWALLMVLFALAFVVDGVIALIERRIEYYAASR